MPTCRFPSYPNADRIFTLIEGNGLTLKVAGLGALAIHDRFMPHEFPGDAETTCTLKAGPCRALNLFFKRGQWGGGAGISLGGTASPGPCATPLLFPLLA